MISRPRKRTWVTSKGEKKTAWVLDYLAWDETEKRRRRKLKTFQSEKEAKEWRDNNAKEVRHKRVSATKLTVLDASAIWIKAVQNGRRDRAPAEPQTIRFYKYLSTTYVIPHLGHMKIAELTKGDITHFKDKLLEKVSRSLAKKCLMAVKGILSEAVDRNFVAFNAAEHVYVGIQHDDDDKVVVPQIAEVRAILAELEKRAVPFSIHHKRWRRERAMIALAAHSGMRASEIRGLAWADVDLQDGCVHVRQKADENGNVSRRTKSKAGRRTIPLPSDMIQILREWKVETGGQGLVFATSGGKPVALSNITRRTWHVVQLALGITEPVMDEMSNPIRKNGMPVVQPKYNFHSLRHFHASMLIADDANPKDVQSEMGHADIQTTFNLYGHIFKDDESNRRRSERSERLAGLLKSASPPIT